MPSSPSPKTIVVAGAPGLIGRALLDDLDRDFTDAFRLLALTPQPPSDTANDKPYTWRRCDLFSRKQTADALKDADLAVYLVHPTGPTAALTQGDARDLKLLCADNFARAARRHDVAQIVYIDAHIPNPKPAGNDSLNQDLAARPEIVQALASYGATVSTLHARIPQGLAAHTALTKRPGASKKIARNNAPRLVRSVQRLPTPAGRDARWVARRYAEWLPQFMRPFIQVRWRDGPSLKQPRLDFLVRPLPWPILAMEFDTAVSTPDRQLYWIRGGLLAGDQHGKYIDGRLEFREVLNGKWTLAAIHNFRPRLPWLIYRFTQAKIHLFVMHAFARYLGRLNSTTRQLT